MCSQPQLHLLAGRVLKHPCTPAQRLELWLAAHADKLSFAERRIADLSTAGPADFERLVVAVRELRKLRSL
mgnify:FL=1